jgi:hypothetical protein
MRQTIGIPMGTDCAPFLANLYLYALENKFIRNLINEGKTKLAKQFRHCHRYIDDLMALNADGAFERHKDNIYPKGLVLKNTNHDPKAASFLDLDIQTDTDSGTLQLQTVR